MKIVKKVLTLLLILAVVYQIILPVNVKATSQKIEYDWGTKLGPSSGHLYYDDTIKVSDGYVTVSIDNINLGIIRKLSPDGELIWEHNSVNGIYLGVVELGDYYYTLTNNNIRQQWTSSGSGFFVEKINKNTGEELQREEYYAYCGYGCGQDFSDGEIYVIDDNLYISIVDWDHIDSDYVPTEKYYKIDPTNLEKSEVYGEELQAILQEMKLYDAFYGNLEPNYDTALNEIIYFLLKDTYSQIDAVDEVLVSNIYDDEKNNIYVVGDFIYGIKNDIWEDETYCDNFEYKQGFILKFHYDDSFVDLLYEAVNSESVESMSEEPGPVDDHKVEDMTKKYCKLDWFKQAEKNTSYFDVSGVKDQFVVVASYKDDNCSPIGNDHDRDTITSNLLLYDTDGNMIETHDLAKDLGVERVDINHVFTTDEGEVYGQAFGYGSDLDLDSYLYKYLLKSDDIEVPNTIDDIPTYMISLGIGFIGLSVALFLNHKKNINYVCKKR